MRILADEEMESLTVHRLRNYGHDVVHVAQLDALRGSTDAHICEAAAEENRLVLTHDDDFLTIPEEEHDGVLFVPNSDMSPEEVADAVSEVPKYMPQGEIESVVYITEDWL